MKERFKIFQLSIVVKRKIFEKKMFDQQNNVPSGSLRDCQDVPHSIVGSEMQQNFNRKVFNTSN